jgi:hypothetical protein
MAEFPTLNFPPVQLKIEEQEGIEKILDIVRRKYVTLTPEEWVRQHIIHYLIKYKEVPVSLMAVEKSFRVGRLIKRFDLAVYNNQAQPVMLVECKAPSLTLNQKVIDQTIRYNMKLHVNFLLITNGMQHAGYYIDYHNHKTKNLKEFPDYRTMTEKKIKPE